MKNIKRRIKNGEAVNGCWLNLGSSLTAEIVAMAGFDWVLIDLEHGAGTEKEALSQLQAIEHTGAAGFVRVESAEKQRVLKVLDFGAEGLMCPHINSGEEARLFIDGLRYPPGGSRGIAKMIRASGYGNSSTAYMNTANENIVGIAQIESAEALNNLDAIAEVDGIDVLFIGPSDLTAALGVFGQFDHPLYKDALKATINAAQKVGKATGILLLTPEDYNTYYNLGIRVMACGSDAGFVAEGAKAVGAKMNQIKQSL